jgi:hypothetical protein
MLSRARREGIVNILFLTSGHNGLSQRLLIELTDRGHQVVVTLATSGCYAQIGRSERT